MITCPFCGYEWRTRSKMDLITCPSCHRKIPRPVQVIEIVGPIALERPATCQQCDRPRSDLCACLIDDEAAIICQQCLADLLEE